MENDVPEDIEEAAEELAENEAYGQSNAEFEMAYKGFIAGAKWQEEQMMRDAVDGEVHPDDCEIWVNLVGYGYKFNDGDMVRIVIVKE